MRGILRGARAEHADSPRIKPSESPVLGPSYRSLWYPTRPHIPSHAVVIRLSSDCPAEWPARPLPMANACLPICRGLLAREPQRLVNGAAIRGSKCGTFIIPIVLTLLKSGSVMVFSHAINVRRRKPNAFSLSLLQ